MLVSLPHHPWKNHVELPKPSSRCRPIGKDASASSTIQRRRYCSLLRNNIKSVSIKTIEVLSLPGPEFLDNQGHPVHKASVLDVYIPEQRPVMVGDNVMVLQKMRSNGKVHPDLLFIASPVSGTMKKTYVKAQDTVTIGDKLFDIEATNDEDETSVVKGPLDWDFDDPDDPPPPLTKEEEAPKPQKRALPLPPLTKEQHREYKFVQNEVECIRKEIHAMEKSPPDPVHALSIKIQLYERILALQNEGYENVVHVAVAKAAAKEEERLFFDRLNDPDPLEVADTLRTLALLRAEAGNTTAALRHLKEAVVWRRRKNRVSGSKHVDLLADVLVQLGIIRHKVEDLEGAKRDLLEAYKLQVRVVGNTYHPAIAFTANKLGDIYFEQGMMEEALQSYSLAMEIYRDMVSNAPRLEKLTPMGVVRPETDEQKRHRYTLDTANILQNITVIMERMEDHPGAMDHAMQELRLRKALASLVNSRDEDNVRIAACHFGIAERIMTYGPQLKTKESSLEHYKAALEIYEAVHGRQHKSVAMVYLSIGALHMEWKQYQKAYLSYIEGAELLEAVDGCVSRRCCLPFASSCFGTLTVLLLPFFPLFLR
jgi:tetratricopeptide (TPR) repeat protein